MDFSVHEAKLAQVVFDRLGVPALLKDDNDTDHETRVIFDRDVSVRDASGMITETRTEIGIKSTLNPARGWKCTLNSETWVLAKKLDDDGHESRWIAVQG